MQNLVIENPFTKKLMNLLPFLQYLNEYYENDVQLMAEHQDYTARQFLEMLPDECDLPNAKMTIGRIFAFKDALIDMNVSIGTKPLD